MKNHPLPKKDMKALVLGNGGARDHALAWKLSQSSSVAEIVTCPGNMGTAALGDRWGGIHGAGIVHIVDACAGAKIDLVVVSDELRLLSGHADAFRAAHIPVFGPSGFAACIEKKDHAKDLMRLAGIPTASYQKFSRIDEALAAIRRGPKRIVVKATGAMAGKGVTVAEDHEEAEEAAIAIFNGGHGSVLLEEVLVGVEISIHAFCDGERVSLCPVVQDHKRAHDGDTGPMTGGMGAVTRRDLDGHLAEIEERIVLPMVRHLQKDGSPFRGMLFPGVMLTADGPKVIEWNCRPGDPESQCLLPVLDGDLAEICWACAHGQLDTSTVSWHPDHAAAICVVTEGYPKASSPAGPVQICGPIGDHEEGPIFHGRSFVKSGQLWTHGGRAFTAAGTSEESLELAIKQAYGVSGRISFPKRISRRDIGQRALREMAELVPA